MEHKTEWTEKEVLETYNTSPQKLARLRLGEPRDSQAMVKGKRIRKFLGRKPLTICLVQGVDYMVKLENNRGKIYYQITGIEKIAARFPKKVATVST